MDRRALIADEELLVRHSGEIPEIAYHNSLYHLLEDPEGPGLGPLAPAELAALQAVAVTRYREIILRDLDPANRSLPLFRGVRRAIWNWQRLGDFCRRCRFAVDHELRQEVAAALIAFLENQAREAASATPGAPSLNCTAEQLQQFMVQLSGHSPALPPQWLALCRP